MTNRKIKKNEKSASSITEIIIATLTFGIFIITLRYSKEISLAVIDGIRLAALSVIPSIFPFFILSDVLRYCIPSLSGGLAKRMFQSFFRISGTALTAFLCGNLCGFPIGVKYASNLYTGSKISKDECERLIGISNNPSAAFTISAVGGGLCGKLSIGILLYISTIIATIITGLIFRCNRKSNNFDENSEQSFDLSSSIKNAAYSSISVCSYIIFFSAVIGIASIFIKSQFLLAILSTFLEVGNAVNLLSNIVFLPNNIILALIAFSLSFSGFSVHMQARSVLSDDISMSVYYKMKLCQGLISFVIVTVLSCFIY